MRFVLGLLLLASAARPGMAAAACVTGEAVFKTVTPQVTHFHDYEIRAYHQPDCAAEPESRIAGIEILKGGNRVYLETGYSFALGYPLDQDQPPDSVKPTVGMDLTGKGPGLLISEWSGGAHCCYSFHIFQLGAAFKALPVIPLLDADESALVRRPGIKGLVLSTVDYSDFRYFPQDFAGSPAGRVFLSFDGVRFSPNLSLMRANPPAPGETGKCAALFKASRDWKEQKGPPQPLGMWYYATDLVYTGNEADAWAFLDRAWGGKAADKKRYLDEYRSRLGKSIYRRELMQLHKTPLTALGQKIDWTQHCFDYLRG
ncbi:MAG TPA: hypothetical protein VLV87_01990 [Gammaproteobacteria bacterium]|nr:hypothetical protein [Gammaproteobacteria bacterium]